jgi:hypothetical protein
LEARRVGLELWPQDRNADDEARKSWFRRRPLRGISATLGFVAFVTLSAHAAPEVQTKGSPVELGVAPFIELVRDGCRYAYHRTLLQDQWGNWYWGRCVPNWWGKGAFLPPD